ncbi:Alpha/Beta hydrolase protein [Mycena leptocephala]|nr:Alpha/Beta hydrolase protein [Mycena leptocephala]
MILSVFLCISIAASFCTARNLTSTLGPVVDLGYAAYAGNTTSPSGSENGPVAFYGNIRYARPPLGELRFRSPAMLNENGITTEVLDARSWGPPCIQNPAVVGIGSEDCLTLNVWKPTNASAGDALPVAGGGFFAGVRPTGIPAVRLGWATSGGMIGVSITYRLNLLGFLGGPTVAADAAGLEWVQRYISKFGGDPDNVSIYGESAGGASIVMQVAAFGGSKPVPFKRAVAQSIGFGPTNTEAQNIEFFINTAEIAGCSTSGNEAMPCLRNASIGSIVSAINRIPAGIVFGPVIEGPSGFLPDFPSRLITEGRIANVEFIGGHCTGDGNTFAGGSPDTIQTDADLRRMVFGRWPGVTNTTMDKALEIYPAPNVPGSPFATQYERATTMAGEIIFTCMSVFIANFCRRWNAPDTVLFQQAPFRGAVHTSDLFFFTFENAGNTFTKFNTASQAFLSEAVLSKEAIAYWTSFAATGNPSTDKLPTSMEWEPFVGPDRNAVTNSTMQTITKAEIQRCQFWMSEDVTAETMI